MKTTKSLVGACLALAALGLDGAVDELMPVPQKAELTGGETAFAALADVRTEVGPVPGAPAAVAEESYALEIGPAGVRMTAPTERGLRYARVTLEQLKRLSTDGKVENCRIADWPRYRWRGYMPDTGRNYLDVPSFKAMLDMMAAYKLNLLHWHMTEHYGWRLESKKYPELHGPKAFLNRHPGKYYTQDEFREIVDYAWARGIVTMPELDVPGHATAFRRAFGFANMDNPRATAIVEDLFRELCTLTSVEKMPFVHMGTDEVWNKKVEGAQPESISRWAKAITDSGRYVVSWDPGQAYDATNRISMLWAGNQDAHRPSFDAGKMYIEILDPFELVPQCAYHTPFYGGTAPENRWGAIFCGWHDGFVGERYDNVFRNQAVFPCCVLYGNKFWNGPTENIPEYTYRLPLAGDPLLARAAELERRTVAQRDRALRGLKHPFHFVAQTHMRWRLTNEKGELIAKDIAQATISPRKSPLSKGNFTEVTNGVMIAETWIRSPKTQTVGAWIGFLGMDRDHGLERLTANGGRTPVRGEWNLCGASAEVNGAKIPPPDWKRPGLPHGKVLAWGPVPWWFEIDEEPFTDQEYFMREPAKVTLREGWNHVKLTAPCPGKKISWSGRSWIMTFCPILGTTDHPREVPGLAYSSDPQEVPRETLRAAALARPRALVYNTDGCDVLYWPTNKPVSVGAFWNARLVHALDSRITTVSYCPQSAGFGHFTCRRAGEAMTASVTAAHDGNPSCRNAAKDFYDLGTDSLEMASQFCRSNNLEVFVSIRMNDQHDASSNPKRGYSALYPQFKKDHPECLMGAFGAPNTNLYPKGRCNWSCVNFACEPVRAKVREFVRQFLENYDVDGIEFDFNRHCVLFRSVAEGGVASDAERALMTGLMRDLRRIAAEVGRRRGRYFVLAMRAPDSSDFCRDVGIDLPRWFEENLVDIWIGSGYFRLTPWQESVALAHRYGILFYASIDESRICSTCARAGLPCIGNRESLPAYAAAFANASAAGVDGAYLFNREGTFLNQVANLDVAPGNTTDKLYFVRYRGSGGYRPEHWLRGGIRHDRLPKLDPGFANEPGFPKYKGRSRVPFELTVGDDFASARVKPRVTAIALTNLRSGKPLLLEVNGRRCVPARTANGVYAYELEAALIRPGVNRFAVTFPPDDRTDLTFNDFALDVRYPAR